MDNIVTVGILSDSHGIIDERIRDLVNTCDHIIHAGDICAASVIEALSPKVKLHAVAGNNDHPAAWHPDERDVVKTLPDNIELDLPGGTVIIEHGHRLGGSPDHEQFRNDYPDARLIVYGHTHKRVIDKATEPWVINPGASGETRTKGGPSCVILTVSEDEWFAELTVFEDSQL